MREVKAKYGRKIQTSQFRTIFVMLEKLSLIAACNCGSWKGMVCVITCLYTCHAYLFYAWATITNIASCTVITACLIYRGSSSCCEVQPNHLLCNWRRDICLYHLASTWQPYFLLLCQRVHTGWICYLWVSYAALYGQLISALLSCVVVCTQCQQWM